MIFRPNELSFASATVVNISLTNSLITMLLANRHKQQDDNEVSKREVPTNISDAKIREERIWPPYDDGKKNCGGCCCVSDANVDGDYYAIINLDYLRLIL